jgi:hypothetical protein
VTATDNGLTIGNAPLLVSPEFAQTLLTLGLAKTNLAGAQVGSAEINGFSTPGVGQKIVVSGTGLAPTSFPASAVTNVDVDLSGGIARVAIGQLDLQGSLTIDAGAVVDLVSVASTSADTLTVEGAHARGLRLHVQYSTFVDTSFAGATGFCSSSFVALNTDLFSGNVLFTGGSTFSSLVANQAPIPESSIVDFTFVNNNGMFHRRF